MSTERNERIKAALEDFGPQRWLEALQNPTYKHLKNALGYEQDGTVNACCLGVLAHAAKAADLRQDHIFEGGDWTTGEPDVVIPVTRVGFVYDEVETTYSPDENDYVPTGVTYLENNDGSIPKILLPSWLSESDMCELMRINDDRPTTDYSQQIEYIRANILQGVSA